MNRSRASLSIAALLTATALGLSACGGGSETQASSSAPSSQSSSGQASTSGPETSTSASESNQATTPTAAPEWATAGPEVNAALKAASSLRLTATSSEADGRSAVMFGQTSKDGNSSVTMAQKSEDIEFTLMTVDGLGYLKGNKKAYSQVMGDTTGKMAEALGDKYMKLSAAQLKEMGTSVTLSAGVDEIAKLLPAATAQPKASIGEFEGQPASVYETSEVKVYIATDGSNRVLAVTKAANKTTYALTDWDSAPAVEAPAADQTVDASEVENLLKG